MAKIRRRVTLYDCRCDQCSHSWTTETPPPRCPKCFSRAWDREPLKAGRPKKKKKLPLDE